MSTCNQFTLISSRQLAATALLQKSIVSCSQCGLLLSLLTSYCELITIYINMQNIYMTTGPLPIVTIHYITLAVRLPFVFRLCIQLKSLNLLCMFSITVLIMSYNTEPHSFSVRQFKCRACISCIVMSVKLTLAICVHVRLNSKILPHGKYQASFWGRSNKEVGANRPVPGPKY